MDGQKFDDITRALAAGTDRRRVIRGLAGGAVGGIAALLGLGRTGAAPRCKRAGQRCHTNADCCPEQNGALCDQATKQCTPCPGGTVVCNGQCAATTCAGGQVLNPVTCACDCPLGTRNCGGNCVDVQFDVQHCGACNRACAYGAVCASGLCTCPLGTAACTGSAGTACCSASSEICLVTGNCGTTCAESFVEGDCPANCFCREMAGGGNACVAFAANCEAIPQECASTAECPAGQVCAAGRFCGPDGGPGFRCREACVAGAGATAFSASHSHDPDAPVP